MDLIFMADHGTCSRKLLFTVGTSEMFGFLMLMKDDFIIEAFVTEVTKWFKVTQISLLSTHYYLLFVYLIIFMRLKFKNYTPYLLGKKILFWKENRYGRESLFFECVLFY